MFPSVPSRTRLCVKPALVLLSLVCSLTLLSGCSAMQAEALGLRSSKVMKTPQQMSNLEICETYAYGRQSKHTRVAIASEWTKRGINRKYCDKIRKEWYVTKAAKALVNIEEKPASNKVKPVNSVQIQ